jgi:Ice-binding-like
MKDNGSRAPRRRAGYYWLAGCPFIAVGAVAIFIATQPAMAATAPVGLGTAGSFAVLAGTTVTNTGPSIIHGNLGVSPGTAVTGFPPGIVTGGVIHSADAVAAGAQSDLTTAYNDAAGRPSSASVGPTIGAGQTLAPGVYTASSSLQINGALTLDAQGDPNAVFIFQAASTLITASASSVVLTNGAQACNVFWQVGSSATLGTDSTFVGSILALTSISVDTGDTVQGRALARNGQVSLDDDTITAPFCTPSRTPPPVSPPPVSPPPVSPPPVSPPPVSPPPVSPPPVSPPPVSPPPVSPPPVSPPPTSPPPTSPPPTPTPTSPRPRPTPPGPRPAPAPTPVGTTFPVTG